MLIDEFRTIADDAVCRHVGHVDVVPTGVSPSARISEIASALRADAMIEARDSRTAVAVSRSGSASTRICPPRYMP